MTTLLSLDKVCKTFGGVHAVTDVSFDLQRGGCLGLIGPNGAGKTTLFNLISGVYPVSTGQVMLDGTDITQQPLRRRAKLGITRSFQNIRLLPRHTVLENVMVGQSSLCGVGSYLWPTQWAKKDRNKALQALTEFGLERYADVAAGSLSYGLRKQIEIVRALQPAPTVLLLDEPAAGLNEEETTSLAKALLRIRKTGISLVIVEHNLDFIEAVADTVFVLDFGRCIAAGPLSEVRHDETFQSAYLG